MTERQARETLLANGVPEGLLGAWRDGQSPFRNLMWGKPDFAMAEELERRVPGLKGLCPLFEESREAVIGLLPETGRFVQVAYEDASEGDGAIELLGSGYQQFACSVLLKFEDAGLSEHFDELVTILRFARGAELRALLDADPYDDRAVENFHAHQADGR